ncbi:ATP-binding protein [Calycomorphotria hydatis]|uniref:histidine kinase n=1 Tax=Calycomorphotria hydatis TaxID=2528027 RepID=A0A517T8D9_9PLAN|nr:ATP-binding protein [Calycomorphotria hydatis]QDT64643.1 Sporulation kinase E [Calycomorphotria hydatis]
MSTATLLVISGSDQGTRFEVEEELVHIGRGGRNEIRILDSEVSRRHAAIRLEGNKYTLNDLNSSNGTFVNGEQIDRRPLHNGDRIRVGQSVILFSQAAEAEDSRPMVHLVDLLSSDSHDRSRIVSRTPRALADVDETERDPDSVVSEYEADLQTLYSISEEVVSQSASIEHVLDRIIQLTVDVVNADRGCILLKSQDTGNLVPQSVYMSKEDSNTSVPVSRSIVDYVQHNHRGVRTTDARHDERFEAGQSILQAGIREALCVPMQGRYELCGVLYVDTTSSSQEHLADPSQNSRFTDEQMHLVLSIARQAALAVENYRYQEALVKAERLAAMGQTIALLSHHIKNILQGVRGGSYLIDMGLSEHDEELIRRGWGIVERNQDRIFHLVMDMLTFSKERTPDLKHGMLNDIVGEVVELMQAKADENNVKLKSELGEDLPECVYDAEGLHRATLNIVLNAIDAVEGAENGAVRVETGHLRDNDHMYVAITDNGPGISEDKLDSIFQIFESTKGARGTGLGLAVSRKILREHGGDVFVESKPGRGCRFILTWPRIDDDQRPVESGTIP